MAGRGSQGSRSAAATAVTRAAAQAASARAGIDLAARPSSARTTIPPTRGHDTYRQTTNLNATCPARNSAGPPRIIHADAVVARPDGSDRTFSSAAAVTMIPATMIGWTRWYADRPSRPGSGERAIASAAASALWSKYSHHSATEVPNATTKAATADAVIARCPASVAPMMTIDSPSAIRMNAWQRSAK